MKKRLFVRKKDVLALAEARMCFSGTDQDFARSIGISHSTLYRRLQEAKAYKSGQPMVPKRRVGRPRKMVTLPVPQADAEVKLEAALRENAALRRMLAEHWGVVAVA